MHEAPGALRSRRFLGVNTKEKVLPHAHPRATPTLLRAEVVWHEDLHDPGDAAVMEVRIERQGDAYRFGLSEPGGANLSWIPLRRKAP